MLFCSLYLIELKATQLVFCEGTVGKQQSNIPFVDPTYISLCSFYSLMFQWVTKVSNLAVLDFLALRLLNCAPCVTALHLMDFLTSIIFTRSIGADVVTVPHSP